MLRTDQNQSIGMSVFAYTRGLLPIDKFKLITSIIGGTLVLTPLIKIEQFRSQTFRIYYLSLILIYLVVFNFKAESPTYVISVNLVS